MSHASGRFIVIEGPDGAGTTTQARALAAALESRGQRAHVTQEPSHGEVGQLTRAFLRERSMTPAAWRTLALLFAADRLDHVANEIQPKLDEGVHVLCDRYTLSSLVYQGLHVADAWIFDLNRHALRPHITLVLDLPFDEAWRRLEARQATREVYDARETQERVHRRYQELSPRLSGVLVDGVGSVDEVTARLLAALDERELGG
jgi:dTMP kinase